MQVDISEFIDIYGNNEYKGKIFKQVKHQYKIDVFEAIADNFTSTYYRYENLETGTITWRYGSSYVIDGISTGYDDELEAIYQNNIRQQKLERICK